MSLHKKLDLLIHRIYIIYFSFTLGEGVGRFEGEMEERGDGLENEVDFYFLDQYLT